MARWQNNKFKAKSIEACIFFRLFYRSINNNSSWLVSPQLSGEKTKDPRRGVQAKHTQV